MAFAMPTTELDCYTNPRKVLVALINKVIFGEQLYGLDFA